MFKPNVQVRDHYDGPHKLEANKCHQWITVKYVSGEEIKAVFNEDFVEEEEGYGDTTWEPVVNELAAGDCME